MSRLDASLDDIIKSESKRRGGGGGGGGGAIRSKGGNGKSRATPYGRPANGRSSSGSKGGGGPGGGGDDTSVHVSNLPFDASWRDIKEHLLTAGDVLRVEVASRPDGSPVDMPRQRLKLCAARGLPLPPFTSRSSWDAE